MVLAAVTAWLVAAGFAPSPQVRTVVFHATVHGPDATGWMVQTGCIGVHASSGLPVFGEVRAAAPTDGAVRVHVRQTLYTGAGGELVAADVAAEQAMHTPLGPTTRWRGRRLLTRHGRTELIELPADGEFQPLRVVLRVHVQPAE